MNSFQMRWRRRRNMGSPDFMPEPANSQGQEKDSKKDEHQGRRPKHLQAHPLQVNALADGDQVSGRDEIRGKLQEHGHERYGKNEAGKEEGRQEGNEGGHLISLQLVF